MNLTDKQKQAIEAYEKYNSQAKAAKALGISRRTFRNHFEKAVKKINDTPVGYKTTKVSTDGSGKVTARTHKLAPEITDEKREGKIIKRSTLYGADGSVTSEWVMRKPEQDQENISQTIADALKSKVVPFEPRPKVDKNPSDELKMINIIDDHMNLKSYKSETGEDFDIKQAYKLYIEKFAELIDSLPAGGKLLINNLGDQFHENDHMKVTPASKHKLDTDIPFAESIKFVTLLNRQRIEMALEKFDTVDFYGIRGNHDEDAMAWLFHAVEIAYEKEDRVNVEYFNCGNYVYMWGSTMMIFDHGDKGKPENFVSFMITEHKELYGMSKYCYAHTGHIHNDKSKDTVGGFLWRSHRTLSKRDLYTYGNKYHSGRSIKGYVISKDQGEKQEIIANA